jgi:hypothetical protein
MNNTRSNQLPVWVLVIGILLVLVVTASILLYIVWQGAQQMQRTIQPVTDVTSGLSTQVAEFLHPTPTVLPSPETIIHEVRSLARLETIQYSLEKVITAEVGQETLGILFGDRMIFIAHGTVIAGVDLSQLAARDLWLQDGTLYVRLPAAEVFIATLDNDKSYVYDRDTGLLSKGNTNLETTARQVAEASIAEAALDEGILKRAQENAESFLYRLFLKLGYQQVIFLPPEPEPTATAAP